MTIRSTLAAALIATVVLAGCTNEARQEAAAQHVSPTESQAVATNGLALFDASAVHEVELTYDQDDYDAMIDSLAQTGDKEWIDVTVTIDGVTYEHAGARLKGNSSLAGLSGGFGGPGGGFPGGAAASEADTENEADADGNADDADGQAEAGAVPGPGGFGGPGGSVSADEPEGLPWLIRLDHFVEDQQHQGYVDIVIRSNNSETSLNEAVALDLLEQAGLASQDAAHVKFAVNGDETVLRLMIEHPSDDQWQDSSFSEAGALYKSESTGDWSYRGDDPAAYDDVFDQEGGSTVTDLTPLIEFLEFVNESDDATFAAELSDWLDVESFATYLAMMELVQNFDDIDGPGNNSYLWWDAETEKFTVVPWDMNLAFGGLGGGGGFPGGGFPGGALSGGAFPGGGERPEGFAPPGGGAVPEGFQPPAGFEGGQGFPGGFGRSNTLVERFTANEEFAALYEQQLSELTASLFDSGVAEQALAERIAVLSEQAGDLVDAATLEQEAESIAESLSSR